MLEGRTERKESRGHGNMMTELDREGFEKEEGSIRVSL